jgi:hypothetical protein
MLSQDSRIAWIAELLQMGGAEERIVALRNCQRRGSAQSVTVCERNRTYVNGSVLVGRSFAG